MKLTILLLIPCLMLLPACEKDEFQYSFETPSKLLVSVKENDQLTTELIYDDQNRLIRVNRYPSGDADPASDVYEYDSQNRLISKTSGDFTEIFEYNSNGKLKSATNRYPTNDREWKTVYQYSKGRISKAITFSDGVESGYITYKYDSRGNTTEHTYYSGSSDGKDMIISQYKYTYDSKINPYLFSGFSFQGECPVDIFQGNNPTYSYYYAAQMSMFPPEYKFTYDYDNTGLPIKAYREDLREYGGSSIFEYEYRDYTTSD